MRFFLKNKGSISIFLAIILVPMLTISGIIVDSSRIKLGKGVVSSAVDLTLNTALTNYDGVLKEIYGLFAMSQTIEELNKNLETHFKKTIMGSNIPEEEADEYTRGIMESLHAAYPQLNDEGFSDFMKIDYSNFSFEKIPNSQLSNPKILKKQVVDFMKYRGPISMGMGFFQSLKSFNNLDKKNDVIEKKTKYYEAQSDVNQICKDIYELIEEYLDISHNERGEGVGITNAYLEFLANQLKGIEENYKGYNKKLVMDLYDNSLEIAPIKYTITGSGGNYTVKSSDGTSILDDISSFIDDFSSVSASKSNFNNRIRDLNSSRTLLDEMENTNLSDLYHIQFLRQHNNNYSEKINDIHYWFSIYKEKLTKEDPETNIESTSEYEEYVRVMDQAVNINRKAKDAYGMIDPTYLTRERDNINNELEVVSYTINNQRETLEKANNALKNAIDKCDDLKNAIADLKISKETWGNAINECPEGEEFTDSTRAEYNSVSELFKESEVDELKDRLSEISGVLTEVLFGIDQYKYGSKELYNIGNLNDFRKAISVKESLNYSGKEVKAPPIIKSELEGFQEDIFDLNYKSGNLNGDYEDIDFRKTPLDFYTYLHNAFDGKEENEQKEEDFKDSRKQLAEQSKTDVESAKEGNSKINFSFDKEGLSLPSGSIGELVAGGEILPEGKSDISSSDSKDLKKDGSKNALSSNNGFIKNMFGNFGDILKNQGVLLRDNLYVTEYIMEIFSYDTFENEIRYDTDTTGKRENLLGMMELNGSELDDNQKSKTITLTSYPINEDNNAAYLSEVEYIIFGKESSSTNVTIAYSSIFGIRFVFNSIYAFTNAEIRSLSLSIATPISAASMGILPVPLVQAVIQIGLALAETSHDVLQLKNGMPVPIYKNKDTWRMSASSIVSDFTSSAANFAIDKAVSVAKDAANTLIDESANYLQEILDKTDQELTELTEEQIGTLEESLNRALSAIVDDAVGGVVIMVTEECSKAVERANAMGEDAINMIFDEFAGSVGSDISGLNAGNPATSIYSFKYSDYLKLFVLIGLYTNSDTVMRRVADVIQVNIDQKSDHTAENFKMSEAYTYARISVDVEVKPILITIPLIADTIKDEETDTRWYKFNYSEIAGY